MTRLCMGFGQPTQKKERNNVTEPILLGVLVGGVFCFHPVSSAAKSSFTHVPFAMAAQHAESKIKARLDKTIELIRETGLTHCFTVGTRGRPLFACRSNDPAA